MVRHRGREAQAAVITTARFSRTLDTNARRTRYLWTMHRLDMRAQLTDEQRMKFDMQRGRMIREHRNNPVGRPGRPAERMMK